MPMTAAAAGFVSPMLVSAGPLPTGPGWAYEVKWDGIRGQAALLDGTVWVRSRPGRDYSDSFPELAQLPPALAARSAVLDGEIVCLDRDGHPDFAAIRARLTGARSPRQSWLAFMAFDVLWLDGEHTTHLPYHQRAGCSRRSALEDPTWNAPAAFDQSAALLAATSRRVSLLIGQHSLAHLDHPRR
jgi:bifunctional non-homologous end joining protein LigD